MNFQAEKQRVAVARALINKPAIILQMNRREFRYCVNELFFEVEDERLCNSQ
jgi:ABC-type antimicrobial peptide transport system ATPase subunit